MVLIKTINTIRPADRPKSHQAMHTVRTNQYHEILDREEVRDERRKGEEEARS